MTTTDRKESEMSGKIPPTHPGDILLRDFLEPLEITQYRLARDVGVQQTRIGQVVRGERSVTAETALLFARYLGTTPEFWLKLQDRHDLEIREEEMSERLAAIEPFHAAS